MESISNDDLSKKKSVDRSMNSSDVHDSARLSLINKQISNNDIYININNDIEPPIDEVNDQKLSLDKEINEEKIADEYDQIEEQQAINRIYEKKNSDKPEQQYLEFPL